MRMISLFVAATVLLSAAVLMAQDMPGGGGMGGGGMGGGGMGGGEGRGGGPGGGTPKPPKPVKRKDFDKIVTAMFRDADTDRNGIVTIDELHAIISARRDAAIEARFAAVDSDRDGVLSRAEFANWQQRMGSAASSDDLAFGSQGQQVADAIMPSTGKDGDAFMVAALIEPLSGTVIAKANTDYDAGVSLEELLLYEAARFDAADADHDGQLSMAELRPSGGRGEGGPGAPGGQRPPCPPGQTC